MHSRITRFDRMAEYRSVLLAPPRAPSIRELVQRLPAADRLVLGLHFGAALPLQEVCVVLGLSPADLESILARIIERLHRDVAASGRDPEALISSERLSAALRPVSSVSSAMTRNVLDHVFGLH